MPEAGDHDRRDRAGLSPSDTTAAAADEALAAVDAAYARFDLDAVVAHLSAAVRALTAADDRCAAAMACTRLGDVYANALGNMTAGRAWYRRAKRLVEAEPPCIEQGYVAIAAMGCDVDDPDELLAAAELALDRARQFGDVDLETKALADAGLARVQRGRIVDGMEMLDEAMALACGPAKDSDAAAKSVCSFFTACYHAVDFERAASWTEPLRTHGLISSVPGSPAFLSSHCDSVQAALLVELGRWTEAEAVLERARADFARAMQGNPAWHPDIGLAELRIRQGRLADAEALLLGKDQMAMGALLPSARLSLAQGDLDLAEALATRGLRSLRDDRLRAVELLALLVEIALARDDVETASARCAQLAERVQEVDVPTLDARAAVVRARTLAAAGEVQGGIDVLEAALDRVDGQRLPWLHASLLVELARMRHDAGTDEARARLDATSAAAILSMLDVALAPDDAGLLRQLGVDAATDRHAPGTATLTLRGSGLVAEHAGTRVVLRAGKGMQYLAELVAAPGVERHVLDLVDRVEGVAADTGLDRRALGDAGPLVDAQARHAYRRRIEQLRLEADDAIEAGRLDEAEARQAELDDLVAQLAAAFGIGGRERRAGAAVERARLNVTRALRTAIRSVAGALPEAGRALDAAVSTGTYCRYEPGHDEIRWIVQS